MPSSSHVPNVAVSVLLQALATPQAGFGTVTLIVPLAANSLDGDPYMDFADYDEAVAANTSGFISAATLGACEVAFAQTPTPAKFRVACVDLASATVDIPDTYALVISNLRDLGLTDLWMVCIDSRTEATQVTLATAVEAYAGEIVFLAQVNDSSWLNSGIPAAWSAASGGSMGYVGVVFHDTTTEWLDVAAAVRALAFDPDETSAPWEGEVGSVADYATFLSSTKRGFAIENKAAVLGTWGSTDYWLDNATVLSGRPWYEVLTAAWYKARVSEAIQTLHQRESAAGRKILVAPSGMAQTLSVVQGVNATAQAVGHFTPGQVRTVGKPITDGDRTARRLRIQVEAMVGTSARVFDVDAYLTQTPVVTE